MYRIFCVEDDETIGKMIKRHLEKWEYDVHVAKNLSQVMTEFAALDVYKRQDMRHFAICRPRMWRLRHRLRHA